tara:strand:- start:5369 stop:6130 length:762 start_codon:yes stop_codon:yes gene_type:complete
MTESEAVNDLEDLKVDEVSFVDKGAGKGVSIALFKRFHKNEEEEKSMKTLEEVMAALSEDDAAIIMQALEAKSEESIEEKMEDNEEEAEKTEEEETEKTEEEEVTKKLQKKFQAIKTENEKLTKRLQKMEIAQERESFVKRAECFPNIPTFSTEELGEFLHEINKRLPAALAEKTEQMIKSVNEICNDSAMMTEFGKSGAGTTGNGSAMKTAESMAAELLAKDTTITKAAALNKVWEQNPALRNQYRAERRGK